jgi:uncharacterized OsmC-like protein
MAELAELAYISDVRLERIEGPLRVAHLPGEPNPVYFSTHGAIAAHYGITPNKLKESHATTIDYVVAATAGWLLGTFAGALAARHIDVDHGKVTAHARGEIENEGGVLVIKRIHVVLSVAAPESQGATIERVHSLFAEKCPVYRSLRDAIQITTSYVLRWICSLSGKPRKAWHEPGKCMDPLLRGRMEQKRARYAQDDTLAGKYHRERD